MVLSFSDTQQCSKMQFVLRNHDGKLMLGSHEHISLLLHVLHELYLRNEELCADVLIVAPDHEKPIPCFSDLLSASSEYFSSLISELRTTKTLAGPIVLFFDQVPGAEIEKMIHFINFGYVYVTPENLHDFVQMCQQFELHCFKKIENTFVFDFYEPSTFNKFRHLPTKKRYSWIERCKFKFDSKTNTNQDFEVIVRLIMNQVNSLTKNILLAENKLAIEAPSSPEPEDTSEDKPIYKARLNFDFCADVDIETDPKIRFLHGFDLVKKGSFQQKIETLPKTRSSSEEKTTSKQKKKPKKKAVKGVKRPRSATPKDAAVLDKQTNKRRCTSKEFDDKEYKPDWDQKSSKKRELTDGRSSYKNYSQDSLDYAVLEVLEGTLAPLHAAEKHSVPSRTVYDRLKKLRDYAGKEDCGVSPYVVEIYLVVKHWKPARKVEKKQVQKRRYVKAKDGLVKQMICV